METKKRLHNGRPLSGRRFMKKHTLNTLLLTVVTALLGIVTGCNSDSQPPVRASGLPSARAGATPPIIPTTDALLAVQVATVLRTDPATQEAEIQVAVTQGRVRLSGFVNNAAMKLRAGELAQQAEGIVGVDNRLILRFQAGVVPDPLSDARVRL